MKRNIFLHTTEGRTGKSLIGFSLIKLFRSVYPRVAFFRPVAEEKDLQIYSAISHLGIDLSPDSMFGVKVDKASYLTNAVQQTIFKKYQQISQNHDIVICDCAELKNPELHLEIANNLNCEVISIVNASDKTIAEIKENVISIKKSLKANGCRILGFVINRALPQQIPLILSELSGTTIIGVVAEEATLTNPSVFDIKQLLNAEVLAGSDKLENIIMHKTVAAKHTAGFLSANHCKNDSLIITPGDRQDILLPCLLAHKSKLYPKISGILLTAGILPEPIIKQIIDGIDDCPPILACEFDTFTTAAKLHNAYFATALSSKNKIELGCNHIINSLDKDLIIQAKINTEPLNKHMLKNHLLCIAQQSKKHLVFPEGEDTRVLQACHKLVSFKAAKVTVLGNEEKIKEIAEANNIDLQQISIIDPMKSDKVKPYSEFLYEMRKHKNMTPNIAIDMVQNEVMFATCMVGLNEADGMVSGAVHTTSDTVRPALQIIKAKPGYPFVCSIFVMCMKNKVVIYGDCALTINPDASQLSHIAKCASDMAELLNISPKVALLSYSSGSSGHGSSVEKVRSATEALKALNPKLNIAGPIQYDAAVDANIGQRKLPGDPVAGHANVLIFPDLDTGNNTYKAVQKEAKGLAIGPILLGLNKPINDLSRGCDADEIFMTALITIIQAEKK